jgi:hypothetical protein
MPEAFTLPSSISELIDVKPESGPLKDKLQPIADKNNAVLLSFIAPYSTVRVSPIRELSASIRLPEEWAIEYVLSTIQSKCDKEEVNELYLIINSPGGIPESCYNIAHMIRGCFKKIKVFVPQVALSGGTLLAMSGNSIVMGGASRLSPIDVQVGYGENRVSANCMSKALSRLEKYFAAKTKDEAPYPWQAMADKLDPVILEDWSSALREIGVYADEILSKAGYSNEAKKGIIRTLVFTEFTHSFVIHRERAVSLGFNISDDSNDTEILNTMREWLGQYAFEKGVIPTHFIRFVIPEKRKEHNGSVGKEDKQTETANQKKQGRKAKSGGDTGT